MSKKHNLERISWSSAKRNKPVKAAAEDAVNKYGWTFVGSGHFSIVLERSDHPDVVKKFGPLDDGWLHFAAYVQGLGSSRSRLFPEVTNVRRFEGQKYYSAMVERCTTTLSAYRGADCIKFADQHQCLREALSAGKNLGSLDRIEPLAGITKDDLKVMFELGRYARDNDISIDLHGENIMVRDDLTLCITDPFSFTKDRS